MIKIIWTEPAISDLEKIRSYIAQDSEVYAAALILELFQSVDQLEHFPQSGRIVPELNQEDTREVIVGNYRVIYDFIDLKIRILGILHGAQNFQISRLR
ncbi:hypothetical protein MNBD_UNCLBAC01-483 [hydrothermal vent metagenome]|uniref:Death on curing protein, Doc toxin n=1 Tax=hydrothermal vent metagenome TaxID=652676 RepID=A0A3B1DNB3_9ZZZZ